MSIKQNKYHYDTDKGIRKFRIQCSIPPDEKVTKLQVKRVKISHQNYTHIGCRLDSIKAGELLRLTEFFHIKVNFFLKA